MATRRKSNAEFVGMWRIYEMEDLEEKNFNMDVQAYIDIEPRNLGSFQFGLISGEIDGKVVRYTGKERFEFTWLGHDEGEPANGSGWIELKDSETLEGEFRIHFGDDSKFQARKTE